MESHASQCHTSGLFLHCSLERQRLLWLAVMLFFIIAGKGNIYMETPFRMRHWEIFPSSPQGGPLACALGWASSTLSPGLAEVSCLPENLPCCCCYYILLRKMFLKLLHRKSLSKHENMGCLSSCRELPPPAGERWIQNFGLSIPWTLLSNQCLHMQHKSWGNLQRMMLGGQSPSQRVTFCVIPFISHSGNKMVEMETRSVAAWGWGGSKGGGEVDAATEGQPAGTLWYCTGAFLDVFTGVNCIKDTRELFLLFLSKCE